MTYKTLEKKILKYLSNKPQGAIIQNFVDDFKINRNAITSRLMRLIGKQQVEEIVYTQNCKVYRLKKQEEIKL